MTSGRLHCGQPHVGGQRLLGLPRCADAVPQRLAAAVRPPDRPLHEIAGQCAKSLPEPSGFQRPWPLRHGRCGHPRHRRRGDQALGRSNRISNESTRTCRYEAVRAEWSCMPNRPLTCTNASESNHASTSWYMRGATHDPSGRGFESHPPHYQPKPGHSDRSEEPVRRLRSLEVGTGKQLRGECG